MRFHPFLVTYFLLAPLLAFTQKAEIAWGEELKYPDRHSAIAEIIGIINGNFYTLRQNGDDLFLESYSKATKQLNFSKELNIKNPENKKLDLERIFCLRDKLIFFASYLDRAQDKYLALAGYISPEGETTGEYKQVASIPATRKKNNVLFDFVLSKDSSKILIYHQEPFEKYASEKFSYTVIDDKLMPLWSKQLELPFRDYSFKVSDYTLDNDGNIYMLARIDKEKVIRADRKRPSYKYNILYYSRTEDRLTEYEVALGEKFISEIAFRVNINGDLICAGFYSKKEEEGIIGTFYLKIDKEGKRVTASGYKEFDKDFLAHFMSERKLEKGKELYNYDLNHLIIQNDGSAILVAEQSYVRENCYYDYQMRSTRCNYTFYFNDIIIVSINTDASIAWLKKIPKLQLSTANNLYSDPYMGGIYGYGYGYGYGMGYPFGYPRSLQYRKSVSKDDAADFLSYLVTVTNEKINIIFNDNAKNLKVTKEEELKAMTNPQKATVVVVSIDKDGGLTKAPLFNADDINVIVQPKLNLQLNNSELIMYGERKRKYKFATVKFL